MNRIGTGSIEIIDPPKEEILTLICSTEYIDCPNTCGGTTRVYGTKDCGDKNAGDPTGTLTIINQTCNT